VIDNVGSEKTFELILYSLNINLAHLNNDIEDNRCFANENKTGAYKYSGHEALVRVKELQKK
jgi:hypothetical protein